MGKGDVIFLARKSDLGDSLIGYGVVEEFVKKNDLSDKERLECELMNWRQGTIQI
ncbi:MAG: hypothetical protein QXX99_04965 [Candidatus Bathyarchaeia archaeon]